MTNKYKAQELWNTEGFRDHNFYNIDYELRLDNCGNIKVFDHSRVSDILCVNSTPKKKGLRHHSDKNK